MSHKNSIEFFGRFIIMLIFLEFCEFYVTIWILEVPVSLKDLSFKLEFTMTFFKGCYSKVLENIQKLF